MDLNQLRIPAACGNLGIPLERRSAKSADGSVTVFFNGLQNRLLEQIAQAEEVLGCVAWLTSFEVLRALSNKRGVSIIVQKEDFLRPDSNATSGDWALKLRALYEDLIPQLTRRDIGGWLSNMRDRRFRSTTEEFAREWFIEDPMDPVRCVGANFEKNRRSQPRMHNKFLIFAKLNDSGVKPYAVWTGSYNLSATAEHSFENALLVTDQRIVDAYFWEYAQISCLSEPLDWKARHVDPEWWLGGGGDLENFDPLAGEF